MFLCDILSFKVVVNVLVLNCVDYRYCLVLSCNAMLMSKPSHCLSKVRDKVYTEPNLCTEPKLCTDSELLQV